MLLGDIHANLPALKAVVSDAEGRGFNFTHIDPNVKDIEVLNVGDIVGYCPFANEVCQMLRKIGAVSIAGNYDKKTLAFEQNKSEWVRKKDPLKYKSFQWTFEKLSDENKKYLESLPEQKRIDINAKKVLIVHGSPANDQEYICELTTQARLKELAEIAQADIVVCGHSHRVFSKQIGETLFVNPGSVGRPEGTDGKACYAILRFQDDKVSVENFQVQYDIHETIEAIRKAGLPEEFGRMLESGVNLKQLRKGENDQAEKQRDEQFDAVVEFAEKCGCEQQHSTQVTKLAARLFDQLADVFKLAQKERFLLRCAGILHDIGWLKGQRGHHKETLKMIMKEKSLPFDEYQKSIIALIARYHRKACPKKKHKFFRDLNDDDKYTVSLLAGILRVADGLDRSHFNLVADVECINDNAKLILELKTTGSVKSEIYAAEKKADLLEKITGKQVVVRHDGL